MELISGYVLPCLYAFLACIGFCFLFNIHGIGMFICAGGAGLGWLCYLLTAPLVGSDIIQAFLAALVISAWSEIMARLAPVPGHQLSAGGAVPAGPGRRDLLYHGARRERRG